MVKFKCLKWLVTNCSILYAITIKHRQFYGSNPKCDAVNIFESMLLMRHISNAIQAANVYTIDIIYNFSFDSIPQDHSEYNSFDTMFDSYFVEIEFGILARNETETFITIRVKSMYSRCLFECEPRVNTMLYGNKTQQRPEETHKMLSTKFIYASFFFYLVQFEISYRQCQRGHECTSECIYVAKATHAREITFHEMPFCDMFAFISLPSSQCSKCALYYNNHCIYNFHFGIQLASYKYIIPIVCLDKPDLNI